MAMNEDKFQMFHNRLQKVFRHRSKLARGSGISCYRLYDHDLPEFPLCIEVYDKHIYIAEYKRRHGMDEDEHTQWMDKVLEEIKQVTGTQVEEMSLRIRMRKPGRSGQYSRLERSNNEFAVTENGLKFLVNLRDYLDTGLFLDHRITREMVRKEAEGKAVLNLFAYTGSFSVYAAAGKAATVDTVDMSRTYLDWAKRNMELNGFSEGPRYRFIAADVLAFLKTIETSSYDIIILDPPTFSNSQRMEGILDVQRDHASLINNCLRGLKPGGVIFFSTNARTFQLEQEKLLPCKVKDITRSTTPFDFQGKFSRWCFRVERV